MGPWLTSPPHQQSSSFHGTAQLPRIFAAPRSGPHLPICLPLKQAKATTLSSLSPDPPRYRYVGAAAEKGYATFCCDRLGTGKPEYPDPIKILQAPVQAELVHALVQQLKRREIGGLAFKKIIGVGHSLGSALTQDVSASHNDFDAIILIGHSRFLGGSGIGFASTTQQIANTLPDHPGFESLPNRYFFLGPISPTLQFAFFYYPDFDTERSVYVPVLSFTGPVLTLNGLQDCFYCQGYCLANSDVTKQALAMSNLNTAANQPQAVTVPQIGHNIDLHLRRPEAFDKVLSFIPGLGIES